MAATGEGADQDELEDGEAVRISYHARTRFRQRATAPGELEAADAWHQGDTLNVSGLDADEVRFHAPTQTVLIRQTQTVTTVWAVAHSHPVVQEAAGWPGGGRP